MTDIRPATAADAAILALHHYRILLRRSNDADATRAMTAFLPWARKELEAGRLIAVCAGGGLEAIGSALLHCAERPAPFERAELLFVYSTDPNLEAALKAALIAEARLRGLTSILARSGQLEPLGHSAQPLLEYTLG